MTFRVGQKVVCVDARAAGDGTQVIYPSGHCFTARGDLDGLTEGEIYTVARVYDYYGQTNIDLREIVRVAIPGVEHCEGYRATRFRPIVEKKTDISSLVALLNPANHKKLEDA